MQQPVLSTPQPDGRVRCDVCQWRCELASGETGRCRIRSQRDGVIIADAHGLISAATIAPIEDHRLWHFFPDAQVLSVGSFGTPLIDDRTAHASVMYGQPAADARQLPPERVVQVAEQRLCRGIVWTYSDPTVNVEWLLDGLKLAQAASRFRAITTTGYASPQVFAAIAPYLDGMRLDVFGFTDRSYQQLTGFRDWRTIFKHAAEARQRWNIHLELALYVVPGVNDSEVEIAALAKWMRVALGSLTPLHVLGSDEQALLRVQTTARAAGIQYVYGPDRGQETRCPRCTWTVISRGDGPTLLSSIADDMCEACGSALGVRTSLFRRNVRYELAA